LGGGVSQQTGGGNERLSEGGGLSNFGKKVSPSRPKNKSQVLKLPRERTLDGGGTILVRGRWRTIAGKHTRERWGGGVMRGFSGTNKETQPSGYKIIPDLGGKGVKG